MSDSDEPREPFYGRKYNCDNCFTSMTDYNSVKCEICDARFCYACARDSIKKCDSQVCKNEACVDCMDKDEAEEYFCPGSFCQQERYAQVAKEESGK